MQIAINPAHRFALTALAWSLALFAALRLTWIDLTVVSWLASTQRDLALWYGATATAPVVVDSSCSGTDVIALCLAVTLSYPVAWRQRLLGAVGGTLLILALNTVRIGTLFNTASQPALFEMLHIYVWPAFLMVATGAYVLVWTSRVGRAQMGAEGAVAARTPWLMFGLTALALLGVQAAAAPWTLTSTTLLQAGVWTANTAAGLLAFLGVPAVASGNILSTSRGAFQVTQECLLTPLVPIYLAAIVALPMRPRTRLSALALALPVFFVLGILRVLVLALPPAIVASPLFVAHGFYQLVAGLAVLTVACAWAISRGDEPARRSQIAGRALVAASAAVALAAIAGDAWRAGVIALLAPIQTLAPHAFASWSVPGDVQGALPLLPAYQLGMLGGLWIALAPFRRFGRAALAFMLLALGQVAILVALGEAAAHWEMPAHALIIRGAALAMPIAIAWLLFRPRATDGGSYDDFWNGVGGRFPDLGGAASTARYRDDEIRLLSSQIADWHGVRVLKTDLWDEARNTRIMQWAADQGADVFGIDISSPTVGLARGQFAPGALKASLADVRRLPFADASFDVVYSMGTVEHFDESEDAVREIARVLRPGGKLVLGVPNRFDPFLRPVLVWLLWVLGHYGYGFEKSYSRRALRRMMERAGFDVVNESGILFTPGCLRMADLAGHTCMPALTRVTAPLVGLFSRAAARFPRLSRHGYLLASTGVARSRR